MTVKEQDMAPDFKLLASNGEEVSLSDYRGKKHVILYFYPKDMTPGCTTQACDFRDMHEDFSDLDVVILGVSPDPLARHEKFVKKHDLPFLLLVDEDHQVAEQYGVWQLKKTFGKEYMGIVRSTFIINKEGTIVEAWRNVRAKEHAERALKFVQEELA